MLQLAAGNAGHCRGMSGEDLVVLANEVEHYLRRREANINARDLSGNTALNLAANDMSQGHSEVVKYLRDRGAV